MKKCRYGRLVCLELQTGFDQSRRENQQTENHRFGSGHIDYAEMEEGTDGTDPFVREVIFHFELKG